MALRIVVVVGQFRPAIGGTEVQSARLANEWAARGHHTEVWTRRLRPDLAIEEREGAALIRRLGWTLRSGGLPFLRLEKLSFACALWIRLLRTRNEYDVVIAQQALYPAIVAAMASLATGRPLVLRIASSGVTSDLATLGRFSGAILSLLRKATRALVVLSRQGATEAGAKGFPQKRIHEIPNGLEPGPEPPARPLDRKAHVVYVGVFRPEKKIDLLLRSWAQAGSPGRLSLAGEGPLRPDLEQLARDQRVDVSFLGHVADVRALLRDADIFVLSSDAEGMSNALLEAMAEGCACLATYVGGNVDCLAPGSKAPARGEIVRGAAGWLVNAGDEAAMTEALGILCGDHDLREALGRAARARAASEYALENTADKYLKVFQALVA